MAAVPDTSAIDRPIPVRQIDAITTLSVLRSAVGVLSWVSPALAGRTFALGSLGDDPRAALLSRLFGARELALGLAVKHPSAEVQRDALRAGVVIDSIDLVASLIALRKGASRATLLTVTAGAALFIGLGVLGLADGQRTPAG